MTMTTWLHSPIARVQMEKDLTLKYPTVAGSPTAHQVGPVAYPAAAADPVAADPAVVVASLSQAVPSQVLVVVVPALASQLVVPAGQFPAPANPAPAQSHRPYRSRLHQNLRPQ